jgi:hypothetical protein
MTELKAALYTEIKKHATNVYYNQAPSNVNYPYVVYTITSSNRLDYKEEVFVRMNVYDLKGANITGIENLAQKLQKELHQIDISTTNGIIQLRNTNRLDLDSIEEEHRRRELSFFVNWYDKSIIEVT